MTGSLFITGFFAIRAGRLQERGSAHHIIYQSGFRGTDGKSIATSIHTWDRGLNILKDLTVVYVNGKLHAPRNSTIAIDATEFKAMPGDPDDEDYDTHLPDVEYPTIFGVGPIYSPLAHVGEIAEWIQAFGIQIQQFFIDVQQVSHVKYVIFLFLSSL
jgi:hypothetical protein